ncbi:MAG: Uncharacterised protein [Polaribacter sp. SA4-10]|nr:MAG: Uncharacterised protein [Polaribacter sp. SA4-10]
MLINNNTKLYLIKVHVVNKLKYSSIYGVIVNKISKGE